MINGCRLLFPRGTNVWYAFRLGPLCEARLYLLEIHVLFGIDLTRNTFKVGIHKLPLRADIQITNSSPA
jgi:hypothetical protein